MSDWRSSLDPNNPPPKRLPIGALAKVGVLIGVIPFVAFGGFMIWKVLEMTGGKNKGFAAFFILFVLLICAVPVYQAIFVFRKLRRKDDASGSGSGMGAQFSSQQSQHDSSLGGGDVGIRVRPASRRVSLASKPAGVIGSFALALFALPFAGFGIGAIVGAVSKFRAEHTRDALMLGMFGLVFSSVGFGLIAFSIFSGKQSKKLKARQTLYPNSPWLWREDWASGQIRPSQRAAAISLWVFAAFWNAISWMVAIGFLTDSAKNHPRGLFLLIFLFPAIGVALLAAAVRTTLVARRFGASVLRLKTLPGVLGGVLEGVVELNTTLPKDAPVQTRLTCLRRVTTGSGENRHTSETTLWQEERTLRPGLPEVRAGRTGVPVFFRLPANEPAATPAEAGDGRILWRLDVEAKIAGPDLKLQFELPVFHGDAGEIPAEDPTAKYQLPVEAQREALHSRIRVTSTPQGGREFYFPAARSPGMALGVSLFAVVCLGVAAFIGREAIGSLRAGASWISCLFGLFTGIFPVVFGGVGLLLAFVGADLWFRRTRLVADGFSLTKTQQWLFLKQRREFRSGEVREIFAKVGMTSGQKAFHDLKVRLDSGREVTLASGIGSKPEADWLVAELKRVLGKK